MPPQKPTFRRPSIDLNGIDRIDYKNAKLLSRFVDSYGKIYPRRKTGLNAKRQRMVAQAIKRSRIAGILPFTTR